MRSVIELSLEMTPSEGGVAHALDIPGCHFRGRNREDFLARGVSQVVRYLNWCEELELDDLNAQVRGLLRARRRAISASGPALVLRIGEELPGAPIWKSGNPAALFQRDRDALKDAGVRGHFRVVRAAFQEIVRRVESLTPEDLDRKPDPYGRSLGETLKHIGDCVWWYCSRLSDELAEPDEDCPPEGLARIEHLILFAEEWLVDYVTDKRGEIVVPERFPTSDPKEPWTHRKACRRQAEHMVEHLAGVSRHLAELG